MCMFLRFFGFIFYLLGWDLLSSKQVILSCISYWLREHKHNTSINHTMNEAAIHF